MIVHLCLLLNLFVFLLVNCFDDPPPPRPRPPPPRPPIIVHQPRRERKTERSEKSRKRVKEEKIKIAVPKPTEPKMKTRECNDNETVEETPSQWGDVDAAFVRSPARGHKKKSSQPSR